jgi:hypothetical protein
MSTYYVDPVNGDDAYTGDSFASGHPWKTVKKSFAAGDIILVAKSPETAQAGTVTATNGNVTLQTTDDLSGVIAQYSFVRIGNTDAIYMVLSCTSSAVTLYRPYEGASGSGLGITTLAPATVSSNDWVPTAGTGTAAAHITLQAGINTSTLAQDGFTIIGGANASNGWNFAATFWDFSRLAFYYWGNAWQKNFTDCTLQSCYSFRTSEIATMFVRVTWSNCASEIARWFWGGFSDCTWNSCRVGQDALFLYITLPSYNCTFNQCVAATSAGQQFIRFSGGHAFNFIFNDCVTDAMAYGNDLITGNSLAVFDMVFNNPTLGSGSICSCDNIYGKVKMNNVAGSATDFRTYFLDIAANKWALLALDNSTYHTVAPAAKFTFVGPPGIPAIQRHYIPCIAGVAKTISVYLRKSSSPAYGSSNLPFMRLRWITGTAPNLVTNEYIATMSDTNDAWVQVSHAVTPSVTGAIVMELVFKAGANNALAWYDDIGVA